MKLPLDKKLFRDFCEFGEAHVRTRDVDPMYWVLPKGYELWGLNEQQMGWFTFLFVAWYNLGNAEKVFLEYPEPVEIQSNPGYSFGLDRRCFRGSVNKAILQHVRDGVSRFGGDPVGWSRRVAQAGGAEGWEALFNAVKRIRWNGHWAAYKWCKLMKNAFGLPITPPRVGIASGGRNAGPIPGLVRLTGLDWRQCATDARIHHALLEKMNAEGVGYSGLDNLDCGLCNFNGVMIGRYYLGKNIDAQQGALKSVPTSLFWHARRACIPASHLGEVQGWDGLRKDMLVLYRDSGVLYT